MRILKEAYTEHVKAVVAPDYVTLEHSPVVSGQDVLHLSRAEAEELVEWLAHELGRVLPETIPVPFPTKYISSKQVEATWVGTKPVNNDVCNYEPGPRTATQTVEVKVGDPNLAYRLSGGRTNISGDGDAGVTDLGTLAAKVG